MSPKFRPKKTLGYILTGAVVLYILHKLKHRDVDWDIGGEDRMPGRAMRKVETHNRWIVVTTIQAPTESLRQLAAIPGWKMVVVGDRKTPKDWHLDGVVYLDVAAQKALGYETFKLLPYDSYTRKTIGYLYAIEHGALYIYETDDDNNPIDKLHSFNTELHPVSNLVIDTTHSTFNPYVHFGQSTMWPRGYPLGSVGQAHQHNYKLCTTTAPAVQQGLVNGDPDVDAIFRLTRKSTSRELDLTFDPHAPPVVLPRGTYAPFNSQNTFYNNKAFWGLILPTTVTVRACDIYRSYWVQTLLWLVNGNVGFVPPNSHQIRNAHSHVMDAVEERELYENMDRMLTFFSKWKCSGMFFFDCMTQLTSDMVIGGFLERRDLELVEAWAVDLASLGYTPPVLKDQHNICVFPQHTPVVFYPWEQNTTLPHTSRTLLPPYTTGYDAIARVIQSKCSSDNMLSWLNSVRNVNKPNDLLLVITIETKSDSIPLLEAMYRPHYPHILYCGTILPSLDKLDTWKVSFMKPDDTISAATCVSQAMIAGYGVKGYIHVSDRMLMKYKTPDDTLWMAQQTSIDQSYLSVQCKDKHLNCAPGWEKYTQKLVDSISEIKTDPQTKSKLDKCVSMVLYGPGVKHETLYLRNMAFYVPLKHSNTFQILTKSFSSKLSMYDFVIPMLLRCMDPDSKTIIVQSPSDARYNSDTQLIFPFINGKLTLENNDLYCDMILEK